ncbi:MAG: hypothetical protein J0I44_01510 [Microbacterium sp.]|uniref:hypothetical protein n=1 Tax=Microbacterium sp. TaxID=51671 RepID=UPI001ACBF09D|nr:hypothetical protein [Microbacterium sp.]MBN9153262.1 hypothetical protein [Microbacterium sp.]MBN9171687.1 hypothetical protein [Microbacterium sp.]MBN9174143.1 hypothetical protein [Microbacterium sp.]MBN9182973.1 hypothetical protein [Microbacterium sp.]MBN9185160.1 hypothetical protein [Microbacterium sp.]
MTFLRVMLIAALVGAAYVVGAKAGRKRYGEISRAAKKVWNDPGVKKVRDRTYAKVEKAANRAAKKIGV